MPCLAHFFSSRSSVASSCCSAWSAIASSPGVTSVAVAAGGLADGDAGVSVLAGEVQVVDAVGLSTLAQQLADADLLPNMHHVAAEMRVVILVLCGDKM